MTLCNATREAVQELEAAGNVGCPLCGQGPALHRSEAAELQREVDLARGNGQEAPS